MNRWSKDLALLLLRFSGVALAMNHGWSKIQFMLAGEGAFFIDAVAGFGFPFPAAFAWAAALAEFAGGILIALGLGTRPVALFGAFTMFVAAFFRHRFHEHVLLALGITNVPEDVAAAWGNPESALNYMFIFLALVLMGGGRLSLDHLFGLPTRWTQFREATQSQ